MTAPIPDRTAGPPSPDRTAGPPSPDRTAGPPSPSGGAFHPAYALVSVALVALITVIAFEGMAVSTAMPAAARDLAAVRSYGLTFSVMLTTQLLGIVVAGVWCDRSGPLPSLYAGQVLFAAGCGICGSATSFGSFLSGRAVAGLGGGLIVVAAYVLIGRAYPASLRPKVFSVISAAWVLPSLLGPPVAAWVTSTWSWRWVFWMVVVPVAVALVLVASRRHQIAGLNEQGGLNEQVEAVDGTDAGEESDREQASGSSHVRAAWFGLAIAASAGALQWGTQDLRPGWSWRVLAAGLGLLGVCATAPALLPRGTWLMRRGLPSVMVARFLFTSSFFGTITYVPLMLVDERGLSLGAAGAILAVGSIGWSTGSWIQGRDRWAGRRSRLVSVGAALLSGGLLTLVAIAYFAWNPYLAALALAACGTGMGLGTASLSVLSLLLTPASEHGSTSSSLQLADVLGSVLGIAAAGAVFAALHTSTGHDLPVYVRMWLGLAVVAASAVLAGRRIGDSTP